MKYLILVMSLLILPTGCVTGTSPNFQKGFTAAQTGDYATALREWEPLAKQGDAIAQYNLGLMYDNGRGVPQDYKSAVKWYRLAAFGIFKPPQDETHHENFGQYNSQMDPIRWFMHRSSKI